jgi:hypothetical protein
VCAPSFFVINVPVVHPGSYLTALWAAWPVVLHVILAAMVPRRRKGFALTVIAFRWCCCYLGMHINHRGRAWAPAVRSDSNVFFLLLFGRTCGYIFSTVQICVA